MDLVVATVGRAHGLRGEVALDVRTDVPAERFVTGAHLRRGDGRGDLVLTGTRRQAERWYVTFQGVDDRTAADGLRGVELVVEAAASEEDDAWYPYELTGLRVELVDGSVVGEVVGLEHLPAQDALVVDVAGERVLVPFVAALVPVVDVPGGRVVLDPPDGLLPGVGAPLDDRDS